MKMVKRILVPAVLTLGLILGGCTSTPTVETAAPTIVKKEPLTVLFQSHRASTLEHCGCHYFPYGGIDREANALESIRAEGKPVLYVDAGNVFGPEKEIGKNAAYHRMKAEGIADLFKKMGLEVIAPGALDFKLGLETLKALQIRSNVPFVTTNIVGEDLKPVFNPYVILQKGNLRVGVLSFTPEKAQLGTVGVTVIEPEAALNRYLEEVKGKSDVVVLLSQNTLSDNEKLAESLGGRVQIVVGADPVLSTDTAYWVAGGKTLLADPMQYGYTLGRFDVDFNLPLQGFDSASATAENVKRLQYWESEVANNPEDSYAKRQLSSMQKNYQTAAIPNGSAYRFDLIKLDEERFGKKNEVSKMVSEQKKAVRRKAISE